MQGGFANWGLPRYARNDVERGKLLRFYKKHLPNYPLKMIKPIKMIGFKWRLKLCVFDYVSVI